MDHKKLNLVNSRLTRAVMFHKTTDSIPVIILGLTERNSLSIHVFEDCNKDEIVSFLQKVVDDLKGDVTHVHFMPTSTPN